MFFLEVAKEFLEWQQGCIEAVSGGPWPLFLQTQRVEREKNV